MFSRIGVSPQIFGADNFTIKQPMNQLVHDFPIANLSCDMLSDYDSDHYEVVFLMFDS